MGASAFFLFLQFNTIVKAQVVSSDERPAFVNSANRKIKSTGKIEFTTPIQ